LQASYDREMTRDLVAATLDAIVPWRVMVRQDRVLAFTIRGPGV
jgi:regulator of protease activity HflC (stomatin/prohibitin superfamily)